MRVQFDAAAIVAKLTQIGERAERNGAEALRKAAHEIRDRARDYAPLEHGGLTEAISVYSDRSGVNRRRVFYVYIDPDAPELNAQGEPTGRTVERYINWTHEGEYNLGKRSAHKAAMLGVYVGPKYLERAADEVTDDLNQAVADHIRKGL